MDVPEIVKQHIIKTQGRMPETQEEVDDYLDLINHSKAYILAYEVERLVGKKFAKKIGFKTTDEIKREGEKRFNRPSRKGVK